MLRPRLYCSTPLLRKNIAFAGYFFRSLSSKSKRPTSDSSPDKLKSSSKKKNDNSPTDNSATTSRPEVGNAAADVTFTKSRSTLSELKIRTYDRQLPKTLEQAKKAAEAREGMRKLSDEEKVIGRDVADAVSNVSDILGGQQVKSELLQRLVDMERETFSASKPATDGSDLVTTNNVDQQKIGLAEKLRSMSVAKSKKSDSATVEKRLQRTQQMPDDDDLDRQLTEAKRLLNKIGVNFNLQKKPRLTTTDHFRRKRSSTDDSPIEYEFVDFLSGSRLNLFPTITGNTEVNKVKQDNTSLLLPVWDKWHTKHLAWLSDAAPRNGFEEMIEWTKLGKMHPYPFDNEYGFFEKFIPFHEHVFLGRLLTDDDRVPQSGPVREFLNLVCNGLSKNPYMRLERKKEHIEWYKEYFRNKLAEIEHLKTNEDSLKMKL